MARFCLSPGCPEVVENKSGWCAGHDPWEARPKWQKSQSAAQRGNGWAWGDIRRRVLRRDAYRCVKCRKPGNEVDHIIPVARCAELGINPHELGNLQTLCHGCHAEKTEADRIEGMRLSRERKKGKR